MAAKYRVSQTHNGKKYVYGHFYASSPDAAIDKAQKRNYPDNPFNYNGCFEMKKGTKVFNYWGPEAK